MLDLMLGSLEASLDKAVSAGVECPGVGFVEPLLKIVSRE
jgi:hypothetical protein